MEKRIKYHLLEQSKILNPNLAYVLGVVLGDGWININRIKNSGVIGLEVKDKDFAINFRNSLIEWTGFKVTHRFRADRHYEVVTLFSVQVAKFLRNFIDNRLNEILTASKEIQASFLKGLFDSEGSIIVKKYVKNLVFFNKDRKLLDLVCKILKSFNIEITDIRLVCSGYTKKEDNFRLDICRYKSIFLFHKNIGFSIQRKQNKLGNLIKEYQNRHTLVCIDCGKKFSFKHNNGKVKRCKKCQRKHSLEYWKDYNRGHKLNAKI